MFEMYKLKGWIAFIYLNKALESRFQTSLFDSKVRRHNLKPPACYLIASQYFIEGLP